MSVSLTILAVKSSSLHLGSNQGRQIACLNALPTKLQSETSFDRLCCAFVVSVSLQHTIIDFLTFSDISLLFQAVACSLYVIGFGESISSLINADASNTWTNRGIAIGVVLMLLGKYR